jgi:hypothetical protein
MSEEPVTTMIASVTRDADWIAGHDDGFTGQTWLEHRRMLGFEAEREHALQRGEIEKRIGRAKAELTVATQVASHEEEGFRAIEQQLADATLDRDRYPTQYSRWMGAAFLLCALAIVGADFPLSRAIAVQILHRRAAAIFSHANLVAWGIVSMGLFFKLVADPFMRPRYLMHRYLRPFSWGLSIIIALALALALAGVLGMLGIFRGETMTPPAPSSTATLYGAPSASLAPTSQNTVAGAKPLLDQLSDVGVVARITFLALALVLPILGGIFAATGSARLHNAVQLRRFQHVYDARKLAYESVASQVHEKTAEVANYQQDLAAAASQGVLADKRYHTYLHGYERGTCAAEATPGIAAEVLHFISRWVAAAHQRENFIRTTAIAVSQLRHINGNGQDAERQDQCDAQPS